METCLLMQWIIVCLHSHVQIEIEKLRCGQDFENTEFMKKRRVIISIPRKGIDVNYTLLNAKLSSLHRIKSYVPFQTDWYIIIMLMQITL